MTETIPTAKPSAEVVRRYVTCRPARGNACTPRGDHLARWLAAYSAGHFSREEIAAVFRQVVVLTKWQVVPERAA